MGMKIDQCIIKKAVKKSLTNGYVSIKDHRNNTLILENGIFRYNSFEQPKSSDVIEKLFLEAFRLSRFIKIEAKEYTRKGSKWVESY